MWKVVESQRPFLQQKKPQQRQADRNFGGVCWIDEPFLRRVRPLSQLHRGML